MQHQVVILGLTGGIPLKNRTTRFRTLINCSYKKKKKKKTLHRGVKLYTERKSFVKTNFLTLERAHCRKNYGKFINFLTKCMYRCNFKNNPYLFLKQYLSGYLGGHDLLL